MLDYWLSRMFYDLQVEPGLKDAFRADREAVIRRYPLAAEAAEAVRADDVAALARRTNPFLLRYYFIVAGLTDAEFIAGLQPLRGGRHG